MPALDSDKVDRALRKKMKAQVDNEPPDRLYLITDDNGLIVASTSMSKGGKFTISAGLVSAMARQLGLTTAQFADMVNCTLSRDETLTIISECP